jgi:large subunit ribosomal protein L21
MLAVIKTGGKQYVIAEKQSLKIEKLPESARKNGKVVFTDVFLVSDATGSAKVGTPTVAKAEVHATIVRDAKADKIRVVKYKNKTRYKRVNGHRQPFTEVMIDKITA